MENTISRYISQYEPIAYNSGAAGKIEARAKEIIDRVELRAQDAVKLDQTPEDSCAEVGHAFTKSRTATQNGMINEIERHVRFTPAEGAAKPDVIFLIDVDRTITSGDEKLTGGTGYTKFRTETTTSGSLSQVKINYGISECDPVTGKHTKEEVDVDVKGPGIRYSIKDMNDPKFREEVYYISKSGVLGR